MKRILLISLALFTVLAHLQAIPAQRTSVKVTQPDGTTLFVQLVGDEYLHYHITNDGYTIVRNDDGYFVYAQIDSEGELVPTSQVAHDAEARTSAETVFLAKIQKHLKPKMTTRKVVEKQNERMRRQKAFEKRRSNRYDYSKFKGLVVLVEFKDKGFDTENYKDVITDMITKEDFTGYYNYNNRRVACTGSVFDYFRDNSMGVFKPQFDIVGPVKIDHSQYDPKGTDSVAVITTAAIDAVDEFVNFKDYDTDKDGAVDMVYFIFAGHGSHVNGNHKGLIWPHASELYRYDEGTGFYYYINKDGVRLSRYACSTELQGGETSRDIDGIGTICHEFSHVLGLPDFYDTDGEERGGQSNDPGYWTLMSQGCYLNNARTPAGYSLFERYMVGWTTPEVIEEEGTYSLERLNQSNKGYRINTPVRKEFFILENRQKQRWDTYLPGRGLLVFRVDSTKASVWANNTVNANPKHNYYELVRAGGPTKSAIYDPFPGNGRVKTLNNTTTPANLLTWGGKETQFGLLNITEKSGVITFDIEDTYTSPETDQIVTLESQKKSVNSAVYDLQGRKILATKLPKGIYIVDGRKIVVP